MAMQLERRPGQAQRCSLHWSAGMCSRLTSCRGFDRIWKKSVNVHTRQLARELVGSCA